MEFYKPSQFAKLIGVSVKTLQRWDNEGTLTALRTPGNRRYYTHEQYLQYRNCEQPDPRKTIIYARVSSKKQGDDLANQIEFIKNYCRQRNITWSEILSDYGSGLNYNRKNWNELLKAVLKREIKEIIITNKDRFVRFGFDWFQRMCEFLGTKLTVINNDTESSPQKELVRDIILILHVFSCRLYGLRKYKHKIKEDPDLNRQ